MSLDLQNTAKTKETSAGATVRVLLLDEHPAEAADLRAKLADARHVSFSVQTVTSVPEATQLIETERFEAIIVDTNTPQDRGLATLAEIRSVAPDVPVLAVSSDYGESEALETMRAGAQDYVVKRRLNSAAIERILLHCMERQRVIRRSTAQNAVSKALAESETLAVF